jgi:hypothetical protein
MSHFHQIGINIRAIDPGMMRGAEITAVFTAAAAARLGKGPVVVGTYAAAATQPGRKPAAAEVETCVLARDLKFANPFGTEVSS